MPVDDLGYLLWRPENGDISEVATLRPGLGVDEADEVDAVLGMLEELPTDQLAYFPGADDHCVLDVCRTPARKRPCG